MEPYARVSGLAGSTNLPGGASSFTTQARALGSAGEQTSAEDPGQGPPWPRLRPSGRGLGGPAPSTYSERRIAYTDGVPGAEAQFRDRYGGTGEWEAAAGSQTRLAPPALDRPPLGPRPPWSRREIEELVAAAELCGFERDRRNFRRCHLLDGYGELLAIEVYVVDCQMVARTI